MDSPVSIRGAMRQLAQDHSLVVETARRDLEAASLRLAFASGDEALDPTTARDEFVAVAHDCMHAITTLLQILDAPRSIYYESLDREACNGAHDDAAVRFCSIMHNSCQYITAADRQMLLTRQAITEYSAISPEIVNGQLAVMTADLLESARRLTQLASALTAIGCDDSRDEIASPTARELATAIIISFERFAMKLDAEAEASKYRLRMNGIVNEIVPRFKRSLTKRGDQGEVLTGKEVLITVCIRAASDEVWRDGTQLRIPSSFFDGLDNAIGNSHKYAGSGGGARINVDVWIERDGRLTATVADNGFGMPEAAARRLYRKRMTSTSGGTGSGSYDCAQRIRKAGGDIRVSRNAVRPTVANNFDHGVSTIITLPAEAVVSPRKG